MLSQDHDIRVSLLSDKTFGQQQNKFQLWRLLGHYEKCLFIDSASLVVGEISNLFLECGELSACVDNAFPDWFSTTMFMFEPNDETYNQLVNYAGI